MTKNGDVFNIIRGIGLSNLFKNNFNPKIINSDLLKKHFELNDPLIDISYRHILYESGRNFDKKIDASVSLTFGALLNK